MAIPRSPSSAGMCSLEGATTSTFNGGGTVVSVISLLRLLLGLHTPINYRVGTQYFQRYFQLQGGDGTEANSSIRRFDFGEEKHRWNYQNPRHQKRSRTNHFIDDFANSARFWAVCRQSSLIGTGSCASLRVKTTFQNIFLIRDCDFFESVANVLSLRMFRRFVPQSVSAASRRLAIYPDQVFKQTLKP